jgi:adenosylmethionine-8-amino-7-oxononanoate aminotransferase
MALITIKLTRAVSAVAHAYGSDIIGQHGEVWIDACSGAISCNVGHRHPHVVAQTVAQLNRADFVYRTQLTSTAIERLAQRLCDRLGYAGALFSNSGSEAIEAAVRSARMHWALQGSPKKRMILSRSISYHGSTELTLSLSGHAPRRHDAGIRGQGPTVPTPYTLRRPNQIDLCEYGTTCAQALEDEILRVGADNIAAFLAEPIVGASGAAMVPPEDYWSQVRAICDRYNVLLIADEVLTGLGRTGAWLAQDHFGLKADIVALGKGLNGGYAPISCVLFSGPVLDVLHRKETSLRLGHTHANHPVSAACANAVLDVIESEDLVARASCEGARFGQALRNACEGIGMVAEIRGCGFLWGIELAMSDHARTPFPADFGMATQLVETAFEAGLIVYPASGFVHRQAGDAIILAPALNTPSAVLDVICSRIADVLAACDPTTRMQEKVYA